MVACLALQLSGCAPTYKATTTSYKEALICCKSMDGFNYESIGIGRSKKFRIDENSPTFLFDSGKSSFKAFRLPASTQSYHVKIESYPLDSSKGPLEYMFYPVLITLDKNYNIVQISDPRRFQPISEWSSFFTGFKFKLRGQLPITEKSKEKYVVVLTADELMREKTIFQPRPFCYYCKSWITKHAPHGEMVISLVRPEELNKDEQEEWKNTYEMISVDNHYAGHGFTILPPRHYDYRFKDLSDSEEENVLSYLNFSKFMKGESAVAFVQSFSLNNFDVVKDADGKLTSMVSLAKKHHEENFYVEKYNISKISIGGADCRRIDFSGKSKYVFFLPMKGYDIACLHPERPEVVIRIGTAYIYPLGESTAILPKELSDFYKGLRFKSLEIE